MSQTFNLNAFNMQAMKGSVDTNGSFNVIPVVVDPNSTNTILPGDGLIITSSTGPVIFVDKALVGQLPVAFALYGIRGQQTTSGGIGEGVTANQPFEAGFGGTIMYAEAGGTITRGNNLEFSPQVTATGPQMLASANINPISAIALDNAVVNGIFRMMVLYPATNPVNAVFALTSGTPISINPTNGETQTLTPGASLTLNAVAVLPNKKLYFVFTTSGTTSYTITFGTNFKSTGTLATGTSSGKVFTVSFVGDGVNYNEIARTTAM